MEGYFVWRIISQVDRWVFMVWGHPVGKWGDGKFESLEHQALESGLDSGVVKSSHRFLSRE